MKTATRTQAFLDWLDGRTGYRRLTREALYENIPGGSRWRYVWGSTLTFALVIQFVTGLFLWMGYSPSSQTAWESVYYIQNEMFGGWFLRGLHHWTAQIMTVLLVLHLMQVVIDGAYKAPREVNFLFGVVLLFLVLALSLTGYLLPWDQKGYWATKVATNMMAMTPVVGEAVQSIVVGGPDYGHHTLTRFFALHAGVLPGLIIALLVGHIYLFRRHGITAKEPLQKPDAAFWPDQVLKDAVACLAVLAVVLYLVIRFHGAHLGAPADPSEPYRVARPDWYFMFLFQLLKYFPGQWMIVGSLVIPGLVAALVCAMPFIGNWRLGHRFNLGVLAALLVGFVLLTYLAIHKDGNDPAYRREVARANAEAARAVVLAQAPAGIPPAGAVTLLRHDPKTQGPKLFAKHCASCHRYDGHNGLGEKPDDEPSGADLAGFGSRAWLAGFLDPEQITSPHYFGGTAFASPPEGKDQSKMVLYVLEKLPKYKAEHPGLFDKVVAAVSAEAQLRSQRDDDLRDAALINEGIDAYYDSFACTDCHEFQGDEEDGSGPSLTGWAGRDWSLDFVMDPAHKRFYGKRNDRMPRFGPKKILTRPEAALIIDWIRGDWYEPGRAEADAAFEEKRAAAAAAAEQEAAAADPE